jgi:uncharacterized membrane protein YbhN (UPF0104 family)
MGTPTTVKKLKTFMNRKLMNTTIIQGKIWIWIVIWMMFFTGLLIINYYYFNHNRYLIISFLVCLIAPLIFFNKLLERTCSHKIAIRLDYDLWSFFIIRNGIEEEYKLDDIMSYGITVASTGYSSNLAFKLKLNKPKTINIVMYNEKQSADQTKTEEILESFQLMINDYNKIMNTSKKIILAKTLDESFFGLVSIYVLSGMLIVAIVLHIVYHKIGMLPLSLLFGGAILMRLIAGRQQDIKRRKKMENNPLKGSAK